MSKSNINQETAGPRCPSRSLAPAVEEMHHSLLENADKLVALLVGETVDHSSEAPFYSTKSSSLSFDCSLHNLLRTVPNVGENLLSDSSHYTHPHQNSTELRFVQKARESLPTFIVRGKGLRSSLSTPRASSSSSQHEGPGEDENTNFVSRYIQLTETVPYGFRKAFVGQYTATTGKHSIFFCDGRRGKCKMKITKNNCRLLKPGEIDVLRKRLGLSDAVPVPMQIRTCSQDANPNMSKPKTASRAGQRAKVLRQQRPLKASSSKPGAELVGTCVTIRWPGNGTWYVALVLGFQNRGRQLRFHKVYYMADENTEVLDLSKREWSVTQPDGMPWDGEGLVGKRIAVYYPQKVTEVCLEISQIHTSLPFEAFVIMMVKAFTYRLLYTIDDSLNECDLRAALAYWDVVEERVDQVNGRSLISWSNRDTTSMGM